MQTHLHHSMNLCVPHDEDLPSLAKYIKCLNITTTLLSPLRPQDSITRQQTKMLLLEFLTSGNLKTELIRPANAADISECIRTPDQLECVSWILLSTQQNIGLQTSTQNHGLAAQRASWVTRTCRHGQLVPKQRTKLRTRSERDLQDR